MHYINQTKLSDLLDRLQSIRRMVFGLRKAVRRWGMGDIFNLIPRDWQNLIKKGESESCEFKSSFNNETIETLSAFANTKGGIVCWYKQ